MTYPYSETMNLAHDSGCWNQLQPILADFIAGHITKQDLQDAPSDLGIILCSAAWENDITLFEHIPASCFSNWTNNRGLAIETNNLPTLGYYQQELLNLGLISGLSDTTITTVQTTEDKTVFELVVPNVLTGGDTLSIGSDSQFAQIVLANADKIVRYKRSLNDAYQHLEERTIRILGSALADQRTKRQFVKRFGRKLFSELTEKIIIDDNSWAKIKSELFEVQDYLGLTNIVISKQTAQFRYPFASEHRLAQFDDPKELQEFLDDTFPNSNSGYYKTGVITYEKVALLCKYCDFTLQVNGEEQGFDTYSLSDDQGGNLGDIESEVFEGLESVIDRLENYFTDQEVAVNEYGNIVPLEMI